MLGFLKNARKYIDTKKPATLVLGNESCDLDSAVSATCLAYYYQCQQDSQHENIAMKQYCNNLRHFVPVLNIPRADYSIKTEVEYLFNKYAIPAEILTFRDDISADLAKASDFILVDHHASPYSERCIKIYDHRPLDKNVKFPVDCAVKIENVGSCATLIAEEVLQGCSKSPDLKAVCGFSMLSLLRSAIILDTVNFNEQAKRATPKDLDICQQLETVIQTFGNDTARDVLFNEIVEARQDVSSLNVAEILRKDLKIISHTESNINIALAGFPLKVTQLISRLNAEADIRKFAQDGKFAIVLLMGMYVEPNSEKVERSIGFINLQQQQLYKIIINKLLTNMEPDLQLEAYENLNFMNGQYFNQLNIKATRKHIQPVVSTTLNEWWNAMSDEEKLSVKCV